MGMMVKIKCGNFYTREMDEKEAQVFLTEAAVKDFHHALEIVYLEPRTPELKVIDGGRQW